MDQWLLVVWRNIPLGFMFQVTQMWYPLVVLVILVIHYWFSIVAFDIHMELVAGHATLFPFFGFFL